MARKINRLNARAVATLTKYGRHADGGGLYLSISPNGGRRWTFLFRWHGKHTEIGLGSARDVTLARARELAGQARVKLAEGINPKGARKPAEAATFGDVADRLMEAMRPSWRSSKHAAQWQMTIGVYAAPLRRLPVEQITTDHVLTVLRPLWQTRPATASRLRGRIERVLDAAKAEGLRGGENAARWRGHLDHLLPARNKVRAGKHHEAMPYGELPAFLKRLRSKGTIAAKALEFTILTAARTSEVRFATMDEIRDGMWVVPAVRMKSGKEHRIPLCKPALGIIEELRPLAGKYLFPGVHGGALAEKGMHRLLSEGMTVHGFRSSFRDWAAECTNFPNEVLEMALAHAIGNRVEAAYRRGDLFEKRRRLMDAWAAYCEQGDVAAQIIPLRA
jgi:integrase